MKFNITFHSLENVFQTDFGEIQEVTTGTVKVDDELSEESENPVQNKVITKSLEKKVETTGHVANSILSADDKGNVTSYARGDAIVVSENKLDVKTVDDASAGGRLPMSAAGVNRIVGNIDALLTTI